MWNLDTLMNYLVVTISLFNRATQKVRGGVAKEYVHLVLALLIHAISNVSMQNKTNKEFIRAD
jgi:hypothetical protein